MSDYFALSFTHVYTFDADTGKLSYERMRLPGSSNLTTPAPVYPPGTSNLPILGKDTEGLVEEVVVRRGQAVHFVQKPRSGESPSDGADDMKKQERAVRKAKKEVRDMEQMARELEAAMLQADDTPAAQRDDDSDDDSDTDNSFSSNGSSETDSSFSSNSDDDMESIIILPSPSLAASASSSSLFSAASSSFISSASDDGAVDEADRSDECSPSATSVVIDVSQTVANKVALDVALPVVAAAWSGSWEVTPPPSSLPRPGVTVNVSTPSSHTRGLCRDDERHTSKRKADDDIEDFRTKRCSPHADAPALKKVKSSHIVVAPSPAPVSNSATPARNFLLQIAPKRTNGSPPSRASRPIRPLPSSVSSIVKPAFGQKRKREADDKEDGELSDHERHSRSAPAAKKPRTVTAPGPSTKVVSRATSRAPAPFAHSRPAAASTRDLSRTTQPIPVSASTAHLRPAADLAHRRWEERMKQMQGGGRIRVVSTDLLAMRAKVRRPRAMQGGR